MSERIVVTGGTGFVGRALVARFSERGAEVVVLSRGALPAALAGLPGVSVRSWDGASVGEWASAIDGASAVFHLAGERAVGLRFTRSRKQRILESRVKGAEAIVQAIERARARPRVLVSASGVGYYGGVDGDRTCDESAPPGEDFLARVCVAWEGAARAAEPLGVRVVCARFGVVIGRGGGGLGAMLPVFKAFVGGPIGSGRQIFCWVHRADAIAALERCLDDEAFSGPVNVAAPGALPQAEFARALARALHRPSWLPAPSFALRWLFGEGAEPILTGQRAVPAKLVEAGFVFRYPGVDAALDESVGGGEP